jgi:hypothetical protein
MTLTGAGGSPPGGACAQATVFLARTSGLNGTETTAYTNLICGMVTDGTYSLLDTLYIFATNTTTTATLNVAQNAFNLTWTSLVNCTFAAYSGITGDGSTCFASTGYIPSSAGGNYALNSASLGVCVLNSRTTGQSYTAIGVGATVFAYIQPHNPSGNYESELNSSTFPASAQANVQGAWATTRTGTTLITYYLNGTSFATPADNVGGGMPTAALYVFAINNNPAAGNFSADKLAYAFSGAGLTAGQVSNVRTRLQTFISAVGGSGC